MSPGSQEEDACTRPRKKARASTSFKESAGRALARDSCSMGDGEVDNLLEDAMLAQLRQEAVEMEKFYLKKILVYRLELESERTTMEKELDDSRTSQMGLLLRLRQAKDRIVELEAKNMFYKNRLRKFEES